MLDCWAKICLMLLVLFFVFFKFEVDQKRSPRRMLVRTLKQEKLGFRPFGERTDLP